MVSVVLGSSSLGKNMTGNFLIGICTQISHLKTWVHSTIWYHIFQENLTGNKQIPWQYTKVETIRFSKLRWCIRTGKLNEQSECWLSSWSRSCQPWPRHQSFHIRRQWLEGHQCPWERSLGWRRKWYCYMHLLLNQDLWLHLLHACRPWIDECGLSQEYLHPTAFEAWPKNPSHPREQPASYKFM